jgi:BirA family transcriptional regulator, biotin operon repressor / biotin---[acetyl-CoA-carboxylase] ligase
MNRPADPYAGVAASLAGTPFANVRYLTQTESTNADAFQLLGVPSSAGLTIVAEHQMRGAGRKGRTWLASPHTSLLFTTILPDEVPARALWVVPFWVALAVRDALAEHGVHADLHWPNDLLVVGKKLCGILCISRVAGDFAWVGCGVGINVHRAKGNADAIDPPPAFCDDVALVERTELLAGILRRFETTRAQLTTPQDVARRWEAAAGLPGARYRLWRDGEEAPFEATAIALAPDGALIVERNGEREHIPLADARALR